MSQEYALELFQVYGNKLTLSQIMKTKLACEYRKEFSLLRQKGYRIDCERGAQPSDNTYFLMPPLKPGELA